MRLSKFTVLLLAAATLVLWTAEAQAQAAITNGSVRLGVNTTGNLNFGYNPATGFPYGLSLTDGIDEFEATSPGCLCEGWGAGIAGGFGSGAAAGYNAASGGLNTSGGGSAYLVSFGSTASTATSVVNITSGGVDVLQVTHHYQPSAATPHLYEVNVTIENIHATETVGLGADGIRYRRVMDWDVDPTVFSEYVTMFGGTARGANLIHTSNNGFDVPLPGGLGGGTSGSDGLCGPGLVDVDFTDVGPCDHGALFDFAFGALNPGESHTFQTFYGGVVSSNAEAETLAALAAVGAEAYSLGQCNNAYDSRCSELSGTPVTFAFGFAGVGGDPISVPEPGSLLLMATGLLGLGLARRRQDEDA